MNKEQTVRTPFWRDNRILPILFQVTFVIFIFLVGAYLINNARAGLDRIGMDLGVGFLNNTASFNISESMIDYQPTDTYLRAILVGILNTIKVAIIGIFFATLIGVFVGISRLSTNWLVQKLAGLYIDVFRNTPLLVQIFIWYFAVLLPLPAVEESVKIGPAFLSNRGIAIPWLNMNAHTFTWLLLFFIGLVGALILWKIKRTKQIETGNKKYPVVWGIGTLILSLLLAFVITVSGPVNIDTPVLGTFNFEGGYIISPEFLAVLLGLTIYTATYIAEIVRGGILSVAKGQKEAAKALGLKSSTTMRLVVFPQAVRIIIPPLTSQYLNLTKNSSLAIAAGYADLVFVANTTMNQAGHFIEMIVIMILVYLTLSLITSVFMNFYNAKSRLVER
ncbi:amino acid ABC transporter permease [Paraliobacillus sediminis]|uniref:amino acid ABC transporter permease n=1 Tax=Paraliobacillus sediminis TaxID=1885916 RepID=UPI000E3C7F1E|nr:ABC transporter permease subunit [Paraliobacillus sediminis]